MSQNQQLSIDELERMRDIVLAHDRDHAKNSFIDLGNPPKTPYQFHKFPMLVYKHEGSTPAKDVTKQVRVNGGMIEDLVHVPARYITKQVSSEEELEAELAAGYRAEPPVWDESGKLVRKQKAS